METAVRTLFLGLYPEITSQKQSIDFSSRVPYSHRSQLPQLFINIANVGQENLRRSKQRICSVTHAVPSGLENIKVSKSPFKDFTVAADTFDEREIKIRVDVSGAKTQAIFDDVFSELVDAAQPIPGFRRVKGVRENSGYP